MKKTAAIICLISLMGIGAAWAQESTLWGSYYKPGNMVAGLAGAYEIGRDTTANKSLGLYPSMEMIIWKPDFDGYAPLDFGLAGEGRLGIPLSRAASLTAGAAAEGSVHLGFRGFDFPGSEYLDRLELYARMGVSFDIVHPEGFQIGLVATSGANYFLDDHLMVGLSYTGWGSGYAGFDGVSLQVRYRMGKTPQVKGMGDVWNEYEKALTAAEAIGPLAQFYTFFYYSVYTGGYYWNGDTFSEGDSTLWRYTDDEDDQFSIERTFIEEGIEGEWWRLKYFHDDHDDDVEYEFLLSKDKELLTLYYRNDSGQVRRHDFNDENDLTYLSEESVMEYDDIMTISETKEDITVPAGTFKDCNLIEEESDGVTYKWYFTDEESVPGRMVQFTSRDGNDLLKGELTEFVTYGQFQFRLKSE